MGCGAPQVRREPQKNGKFLQVLVHACRSVCFSSGSCCCILLYHTAPLTQAREEAQTALDVVEGFAALNRKLVDELR